MILLQGLIALSQTKSIKALAIHPTILDGRESFVVVFRHFQVPLLRVIIVVKLTDSSFILHVTISLEHDSVNFEALNEVSAINFYFKAVKQVLEDDGLDNAALHVVNLPASLNYFLLLAIEVVQHEAGRDAQLVGQPGDERDAVRARQSVNVRQVVAP